MPALLGMLLSTILSTVAVKGATSLIGKKTIGTLLGKALSKSPALMSAGQKVAGSGIGQSAAKMANASTKGGHSLRSVSSGLGREAGNNLLYMGAHLATLPLIPDAISPYGGDNDSNLASELQHRMANLQGLSQTNSTGMEDLYQANIEARLEKLMANMPQNNRVGGIL